MTPRVDPEEVGLDGAQLRRIDEHLTTRYLDPGKIAGCQTWVIRHGQVAYASSLGLADRERGRPVADDTIWRLYSMTKPITGVALMQLYERGLFQLSDPVHRFIPSWRDVTVREVDADGRERIVPADRPPSIRDVMMHMSGIGYAKGNGDLDLANVSRYHDLEELASDIVTSPLRYQPGTQWLYSFGMDVCARLVEILADEPFDDYLQREIFDPLGMVDTGFSVSDDQLDRFAACYGRNSRKELVLVDDPERSAYRRRPTLLMGGGGLVGSGPDYVRFVAMLAAGGTLDGARILGPRTVELMATNHLPGGGQMTDFALPGAYGEVGFEGMGFGLTMAVGQGPAATQVIGSAGEFMWGGAASTAFWVDPVEDLAVVFMTQLLPSGTFNFRGQLRTIVYPAITA
ncbi:MAG TPA: serine hydrolase domain-containing protein [Acidimicrobiales bacterium]|nr:serine hydrolase domain-containing protein [Acidimicrobiales bacterium]